MDTSATQESVTNETNADQEISEPGSLVETPEGKPPEPAKEEPKKEVKKEEDRLAPRFAALSRREKEIRAKELKIKERESKISNFEALMSKAKADPDAYLKAGGLDYEYLTQYVMNDKKPPESIKVDRIGDEVKELKKQLEQVALEKQQIEVENQQRQAMSHISEIAKENAADLPLSSRDPEAIGLAFDVIKEYYFENGEPLDVKEALLQVESHLQSKVKEKLDIYKSTDWFKSLFAQSEPKTDPAKATGTPAKTLTQKPAVSSSSNVTFKSDADRMMAIANAHLKTI